MGCINHICQHLQLFALIKFLRMRNQEVLAWVLKVKSKNVKFTGYLHLCDEVL